MGWKKGIFMGYLKGQFEGAATAVLLLLVIGMVLVFLLIELLAIKAFILSILLIFIYEYRKKDTRVSFSLIALLGLLILTEFAPIMIDVPALVVPELCLLHYAFPLHFALDMNVVETCTINAAVSKKDLSLCNSIWVGKKGMCVEGAFSAGAENCEDINRLYLKEGCFARLNKTE